MPQLSVTSVAVSATVDLSAIGVTDWLHSAATERTGGAGIGALALVGATSAFVTGSPAAPVVSATNPTVNNATSHYRTTAGVSGVGTGFQWVVDVSHLAPSRIYVYSGAYSGRCRLTVSLSDSSASTTYAEGATSATYAQHSDQFEIVAQAASAGQTVTVFLELIFASSNGSVNAAAQFGAMALANDPPPPSPRGWRKALELLGRGMHASPPAVVGQEFVDEARTQQVGVNLESLSYYNPMAMFTDIVRQGNYWTDASIVPVAIDLEGWPTTDFRIVVQWQDDGQIGDTLKCEFNGYAATITTDMLVNVQNTNGTTYDPAVAYSSGTNKTTFNLVYTSATGRTQNRTLVFGGTRKTGGSGGTTNTGVTNLRILRPGYELATAPKFFPPFVEYLQAHYTALRFMALQRAWMNLRVFTWSQRVTPSMSRTAYPYITSSTTSTDEGIPYEDIADFANLTGMDIWICLPINCDDAYVTSLATWLQTNITNAAVKIYLEYSNEIWGTIAPVTYTNWDLAAEEKRGFWDNGTDARSERFIDYMSRNSDVVTVRTNLAHGAVTNDLVHCAIGIMPTAKYTCTRVDDYTVTFAHAGTAGLYGQGTQHFTINSVLQSYVLKSLTHAAGIAKVRTYTAHGHSTGHTITNSFTEVVNSATVPHRTWSPGGRFATVSIAANVVTATTNTPHSMSSGATITGTVNTNGADHAFTDAVITSTGASSFTFPLTTDPATSGSGSYRSSAGATITVIDANTYTYSINKALTGYGARGSYGLNSSMTITFDAASNTGLAYDGDFSAYAMARKRVGRRICEISDLFRAVWTTGMMTRIRPVYAYQAASSDHSRTLAYIQSQLAHPPSYYLYGAALANYFGIWEWFGGTDLTYDTTPHTVQDYLDRFTLTGSMMHTWWAKQVGSAAKYNVKLLMYEAGPDNFGDKGNSNNTNANAANFDPQFRAIQADWMAKTFQYGAELVMYFNSATQKQPNSQAYGCWADKESLAAHATSVKLLGIDDAMAATQPYKRNPVPGRIDGRATKEGFQPFSGAYPHLGTADFDDYPSTEVLKYIVAAPEARDYALTICYSNTLLSPARTFTVTCNGTVVSGGPFNIGFTIDATTTLRQAVTVPLRLGMNQMELRPDASASAAQIHWLDFV